MSRRRQSKKRAPADGTGVGRATKGSTAAGRLALFDPLFTTFLRNRTQRGDNRDSDPVIVVDVGLGATPVTFMEWRSQLVLGGAGRFVGIERERAYFERTQLEQASWPAVDEVETEIIHGGFDAIPDGSHVVRIANVLRVYPLDELRIAEEIIGRRLSPSGVVVEITCDPKGSIGTALVSHRNDGGGLNPTALLFGFRGDGDRDRDTDADADASGGFAPWRFRDWLPRRYRRHCHPGTPFAQFFESWTEAWKRSANVSPLQSFTTSSIAFAATRADIEVALLSVGLLRWNFDEDPNAASMPSKLNA